MARIAIISIMGAVPWGGSEYLWAAMAEQALLEEHEVLISIYDWPVLHPSILKLQQQGAQLFTRSRSSSLLSRAIGKMRREFPFSASLLPKSSHQATFDWKPDVVCISQGHMCNVIYDRELIQLLNLSAIPYVIVSQLNSDSLIFDSNTQTTALNLFSQAVYHVFVSYQNLRLVERQLAHSLPNGVVLQNPVNLFDLSIASWPYQSTIYFANVARLDALHKGQDVLFEALSASMWRQRNWQCHLYGVGPDQGYFEALIHHYGIAERVKFMGHVNDIHSVWLDNHVLVMPSRSEGTPLALVEAMLCGRPAVVTDVGGNAEWIEEGKTGFIAEAPTARSFGAALNRAWLAQSNWKQMGIQAHEDAINRFDRSPGQSLLKLILSALKNQ